MKTFTKLDDGSWIDPELIVEVIQVTQWTGKPNGEVKKVKRSIIQYLHHRREVELYADDIIESIRKNCSKSCYGCIDAPKCASGKE